MNGARAPLRCEKDVCLDRRLEPDARGQRARLERRNPRHHLGRREVAQSLELRTRFLNRVRRFGSCYRIFFTENQHPLFGTML
jgi:hypothetical protein